MNRAQKRAMKRAVATALSKRGTLAHPAPESVTLYGGPMDGWVVAPDADALRSDWYTTWPPSVAARHAPGRYERRPGTREARWQTA